MTHDELLEVITSEVESARGRYLEQGFTFAKALRAVVELHKPRNAGDICIHCSKTEFWMSYPCPTIRAIEKELLNGAE